MKEVRNLGRCWAGDSASLSSPARRFVQNNNDPPGQVHALRVHSVRTPTICHLWVAGPLRVVRSPVVFLVATLR